MTANPLDLPARRGGDDGSEVDGNSGDRGIQEWGGTGEGNAWERVEVDESGSEARGNRGARGAALSSRRWHTGCTAGSGGDEREPPPGRLYRGGEGDDPGRGWAGRSSWAALAFWDKGDRGSLFRLFSF